MMERHQEQLYAPSISGWERATDPATGRPFQSFSSYMVWYDLERLRLAEEARNAR